MFAQLRASLILGALAAFVLLSALPETVEGQVTGRFRVLVPDLKPTDGSQARFGERVAERLRNDIDLDRHIAINRRDMERAARDYNIRRQDLDCITARQLAPQIDAQVVMCGEYAARDDRYVYEVVFWTVPDGDAMRVPVHTVSQRDEQGAANFVLREFEEIVERLLRIGYCGSAVNSSNWEEALNQCTQAYELEPDSRNVKLALANTYRALERYAEALVLYEELIEEDGLDDSSIQNAAWLSAQLGDTDKAFRYYSRYLELNPANVQVRITLAYDLGQAGNPRGAMELLRDGFDQEPDNVDLHEQFGSMAFRAAIMLQAEQPQSQDSDQTLSPEVANLYREAVRSFEVVLEARGAEARPQYATNSMRALMQLGQVDDAIALGTRAAQVFTDEADIHSVLADAYNRTGDLDRAIRALDRAIEINPEATNQPRTRKATFLLQARRLDEAVAAFQEAVAAEERTPDQVANMIFGVGYTNFIQNQQDISEGIRYIERARTFQISQELRSQFGFFHGFALYSQARALYDQNPNDPANAQRLLPMFQEAKRQLAVGAQYGQANQRQQYPQLVNATDELINIQELVIRRGR